MTPTQFFPAIDALPGTELRIVATPGQTLEEGAAAHRAAILQALQVQGAALLRGFQDVDAGSFQRVVQSFCAELMLENGEHIPEQGSDSIYTPVVYAAEQKLLWHNENSFNAEWPDLIAFCSMLPAASGGETTLIDSRQMMKMLDPGLVREFTERQVCYVRTMGLGVGRSWQQVFRTQSRAEAEQKCRAQGFAWEWLDEDVLQTRCVRPAVITHPQSGALSWFNQAQHWHPYFLEAEMREELLDMFGPQQMPRDCRFGDGGVISDAMMAHIAACYEALEWLVAWQQGDVLLVDNVALAHARNPYRGPRKLLVAMGRNIPGSKE